MTLETRGIFGLFCFVFILSGLVFFQCVYALIISDLVSGIRSDEVNLHEVRERERPG